MLKAELVVATERVAWVELSVLLRNHERALADAMRSALLEPLPASSVHALLALYHTAPMMASDIARAVGMPATAFTPVLDRLEELDLICRRSHPDDRRAVLIHLTARGEAWRNVLVPLAQRLNEALWQQVTEL